MYIFVLYVTDAYNEMKEIKTNKLRKAPHAFFPILLGFFYGTSEKHGINVWYTDLRNEILRAVLVNLKSYSPIARN